MTLPEALDTTCIHSVAGLIGGRPTLVTMHPSAAVLAIALQLSRETVMIPKPSENDIK